MCIIRTIGINETSDKIDYEKSDWSIAILMEKMVKTEQRFPINTTLTL